MRHALRSLAPSFALAFAALLGCSDDAPQSAAATSATTGAGGSGGTGAGGSGEAGGGGAGGGECAPVTRTIGPEGGELTLCGARLVVPSGAVADPTEFGITRVDPPPAPPFDMELAGSAFQFTPSTPAATALLSVTVPRGDAVKRVELGLLDEAQGTFGLIEACEVTETTIQQFVGGLGTFASLRYLGDLPDNSSGLGDGTIQVDFQGEPRAFDLDEPGAFGIYRDAADGSRLVTVLSTRALPGDAIERIRFDLSIDVASATGHLIVADLLSTAPGAGGFSFIDGLIGSDGEIALGDLSDGRLRGQIVANLQSGQDLAPFQATLDVAVERYIFPPELSCPGAGE